MAELTIYRGTHQIGGCCTEIVCDGERVLIDLGANLPDCDSPVSDDTLLAKVFDGRSADALLFTHPHGDHYGLYKKVPADVPMYIGPMAKEMLKILVSRSDHVSKEKGLSVVERMRTYQAGKELETLQNVRILPLYVDHSVPDAHMFYIRTAGKRILFTGDFRTHGIIGERNRLWRVLEKYVPKGIDLLLTEGTMLSRDTESTSLVQTEEELGQQAEKLFRRHKYNFVLVSSTNLDSIMEFYHHTPPGMCFVCDDYQAEVMLTVMRTRKSYARYQVSPDHAVIDIPWKPWKNAPPKRQIAYTQKCCARLRKTAQDGGIPLDFRVADSGRLFRQGFVMLVRKNCNPDQPSVFEIMRDKFYPPDGQIIYSMWDGYLESEHADQALLDYIGDRRPIHLHTSGHAYAETIAKLIETVQPKKIVPMHTERADEFTSISAFAPYRDQVQVLHDGERLSLDRL